MPSRRRKAAASDPIAYSLFGCTYAHVQRYWQGQTLNWWKSGLEFGGPTWWDAIAAANPVTIYSGETKTLTGRDWFVWFQRKALAAAEYNAIGIVPNPYYTIYTPSYPQFPFPSYPHGPWIPPAPPADWTLTAASGRDVSFNITVPDFSNWMILNLVLALTPPGLSTTRSPHYMAAQGVAEIPPHEPATWPLTISASQFAWTARPGDHITMGLWYQDGITQCISPTSWQTIPI